MKTFCHSDFAVECREDRTGQGKLNFPQGDSMIVVPPPRIFTSLFSLLSSSFFSPLFRLFCSFVVVRERDGLAGWRPPLGADSSLINGFKVSLIESNFLVLPVILIRRETENGYHNFSHFEISLNLDAN